MDFLQSIANFFHNAYCYFSPEAESCAAPSAARTAVSHDEFQPLAPIATRRLEEIVRESRPVEVGCYIRMERVHHFTPEQLQQLTQPRPAEQSR